MEVFEAMYEVTYGGAILGITNGENQTDKEWESAPIAGIPSQRS